MTTLISQTPIAVRNPFALLESEHCAADRISADDELDLSTWCVVNSPYPSDDEDDEDHDNDEDDEHDIIYHWRPSTDSSSAVDSTNTILPSPLKLSLLSDGFTNISKVITVKSTNSVLASAPEHRGAWVVKMSKARQNHSSKNPPLTLTDDNTQALEASRAEKRKDIPERSDDDDGDDSDDQGLLYMSMTEHELSKSSKASKLKNTRVATHHSRELARALGCFSEEADKIDKKAVRSRSGKSRTKNRACKPKVLPGDY
ncbi:hypothetical protein BGZ70_000269 [Mortierella alpina]|uniref:Uncharacterized protein n=1 Tax=Mortierella alpina TaxID=64518 RepID=A0A9P6IYC5_MORAP|nr:hypothetical protein BGZ70_000269 [Mortierella alpina]